MQVKSQKEFNSLRAFTAKFLNMNSLLLETKQILLSRRIQLGRESS